MQSQTNTTLDNIHTYVRTYIHTHIHKHTRSYTSDTHIKHIRMSYANLQNHTQYIYTHATSIHTHNHTKTYNNIHKTYTIL